MEVLKITWLLEFFTLRKTENKTKSWAHQKKWLLQTFIAISWSFLFLPFTHIFLTATPPPFAIRCQICHFFFAFASFLYLWKSTYSASSTWGVGGWAWGRGQKNHGCGDCVLPFRYRASFIAYAVAKMDPELILVLLPCFAQVEGDTGCTYATHADFPTALKSDSNVRSSIHRLCGWEIADAIFLILFPKLIKSPLENLSLDQPISHAPKPFETHKVWPFSQEIFH